MELRFESSFSAELHWWVNRDRKVAKYIEMLLRSAEEDPFHGLGDPRLIKELGRGVWGCHIVDDHFLISWASMLISNKNYNIHL